MGDAVVVAAAAVVSVGADAGTVVAVGGDYGYDVVGLPVVRCVFGEGET